MSSAAHSNDHPGQPVAPLSALSLWWLTAALLPLILTLLIIGISYTITGGTEPTALPQFPTLVYGLANVVVVAAMYGYLSEDLWRATAPFPTPTKSELGAGVLATAIGVAIGWPLTTVLSEATGVARYAVPSLSSPFGIAALFLTAVAVAPVAEEILFRGLFLGLVLDRGYGPVVAGGSSLMVFAGLHVFTAGIGGVINALLLGLLLTWLRLRYESLVGAWLMHLLNNLLEFFIGVSLLPSLYAL